MKLKTIIPISLIVVFVMGLIATPAFASRTYQPDVQGPTRWSVTHEPYMEAERYAVVEDEKPGLIAGVFSAANWIIDGTMDMAGATYDSTEKLTRDVLTSSGETVDSAVDSSRSAVDGTLEKSGEIVDGTLQFTDDTVRGTTGAVLGSEK